VNNQVKIQVPNTAAARGKVAPARMAHIVFKTPKFEKMVRWWCTVLEAKPVMENGQLAFLTYDNEHHRVAIISVPALFPNWKFTRGMDHVAYTYSSLQELLFTYERLFEQGIKPIWAINHGPTTSIYYQDPDKNQVELQVDNFDSHQEFNDFVEGGDFQENPIGVDFDPKELMARLRSGVSDEELKKRSVIGKRGIGTVPRKSIGNLHKVLAGLAGLVGR